MSQRLSPEEILNRLQETLSAQGLSAYSELNVPMAQATTFEIGGPADVVIEPASEAEVATIAQSCKAHHIPLWVLGCGSNILVSDEGLRGVVLRFTERFSSLTVDHVQQTITVQAGASNAYVSAEAQKAGLSGYEFACGIPGTIGGAALMNAGAYGGDFSQVGKSVRCLMPEGNIIDIPARDAAWSYRHSAMQDNQAIILGATLQLHADDPQAIQARIDDLTERRQSKQPLGKPSAGSTFKRPDGYFVGQLIEEAGLKGYSLGGAQVSEVHTGFVVNNHHATASDVRKLIAHIQAVVKEMHHVDLVPEVRFWGFGE